MAANIATDKRSNELMTFTADTAAWWDLLGERVTGAQSVQDVLLAAHLDWTVDKVPLYVPTPNGIIPANGIKPGSLVNPQAVESHVAIVRNDTQQILGIVGSGYQPLQNLDALQWADTLLGEGAMFESAGGLGQGERIWLLARVPKADFVVGKADEHKTYLLITTSHDGSLATTIKQTTIRVVCQNTLTQALQDGKAAIRIKHTRSADERMRQARCMIQAACTGSEMLAERLNALAQRKVTRKNVEDILGKLFPFDAEGSKATLTRRENTIGEILTKFGINDNGAYPEQAGTAFAMLNAVTDYVDHDRGTRIRGNNQQTIAQSRAEASVWGSGDAFKGSALATIEAIMADAPEAVSDADIWSALGPDTTL